MHRLNPFRSKTRRKPARPSEVSSSVSSITEAKSESPSNFDTKLTTPTQSLIVITEPITNPSDKVKVPDRTYLNENIDVEQIHLTEKTTMEISNNDQVLINAERKNQFDLQVTFSSDDISTQ